VSITTPTNRRIERAERRVNELRAWRNARQAPIPDWWFVAPDGTGHDLGIGDPWPVVDGPVRFSATAEVPADWGGQPVELELWLGGEAIITLSTGLQAGLDPYHHAFPLFDAAEAGARVQIEAEVMPKGLFGSHITDPHLDRAHLVIPHTAVRALERDLSMILAACRELGEHEVVPHLLATVEAAYASLDATWPSGTDVTVTRLVTGYEDTIGRGLEAVSANARDEASDVGPFWMGLWQTPPAPRDLEPLPGEAVVAVVAARGAVAARLDAIRGDYPPVGRLCLTGHAHIDLGWLWPVAETRRKVRRTFSTVLSLMDRYDDFTFNQSSAQAYAWAEQDDPELFAGIARRVEEGRWDPVGGSWAEPDCEVTGGESFVRHLLYGQAFWQSRFGRRARVAWLPDVFGFSPGIPQLLRGAGLTGFFTIKLNWNEANVFPHDLFTWEGLDGSTVTAHMFLNPGFGYNGNVAPLDTLGTWRNFRGKVRHPESLLAIGWGDGGGGPTARMLENYERLKGFPALPRLRMGHVDRFYDTIDTAALPRWSGELYLELHRGTLTSQAKVKHLNRQSEHRLLEAEAFAAIASGSGYTYPLETFDGVWKSLLLNQFHDILPGSSIAEVYRVTHPELEAVVATASGIRDAALGHLAGTGPGTTPGGAGTRGNFVVANAALATRSLVVTLPAGTGAVSGPDGAALPSQETEDGLLVVAPGLTVPGLGTVRLGTSSIGTTGDAAPSADAVRAGATGGGATIENSHLRVEIGPDGWLRQVTDLVIGRQVLDGPGNQLWAYTDKPRGWDAWDVAESYPDEGEPITAVEAIEVVESGPLRAAVRIRRTWRGSRIDQTYRLVAGSSRLDIVTELDWHERAILLRSRFPLAIHTHEATFETMYGVVRRPTHRNTSWDEARFEVGGHRFADLSEAGYGVAPLNDAKYGFSAEGGVLGISLLRSPRYPDPHADEGAHRFTYSLFPHAGDWTDGGVVTEAFALNSPLVTVAAPGDGGAAGTGTAGFVTLGDGLPLSLGSLKAAEDGDGLILRLHEPHGARGTAALRFASAPSTVEFVDLLERPVDREAPGPGHTGDTVTLTVRPFEVVTLRLRF